MIIKCPECKSLNILLEINSGECFCKDCGLVIEDELCSNQQDMRKPSQNTTFTIHHKKHMNKVIYTSKEKYNYHRTKEIKLISSRLKLPDFIQEHAYAIYVDLSERDLCHSKEINTIFHSCISIACQMNGLPRTVDEITDYSTVDSYKVLKFVKFIKKELRLHIPPTNPIDLVPRFISILRLSSKCERVTIDILHKIENIPKYQGKKPKSLISGALYVASKICNLKLSQTRIAVEVCVRETTIKRISKEIMSDLNIQYG